MNRDGTKLAYSLMAVAVILMGALLALIHVGEVRNGHHGSRRSMVAPPEMNYSLHTSGGMYRDEANGSGSSSWNSRRSDTTAGLSNAERFLKW